MSVANRPALMATARSLSIDRVAAEVAAALSERGVDCMLVKGPAVARALYADGGRRTYVDCDLLVCEDDVAAADAVLTSLGFTLPLDEDAANPLEFRHSHTWGRARDRATVDLHWTFVWADAPPKRVWEALRARAEETRVGGRELPVADASTTVLLAALQLLHHGPSDGAKFQTDVERAIGLLDEDQWRAAVDVAAGIGARRSFGAALRLVPGGREMAERLGIPDDAVVRALTGGPPSAGAAKALELVARRAGIVGKLRLLMWLLVPPRAYLEWMHPTAHRSGLHLAAIYALRPFDLMARAPATLAAWRRARRSASG